MRTRRQDKLEAVGAQTVDAAPTAAPTSPVQVASTKIESPAKAILVARKGSKLPKPLQFPLVTILSLSVSTLGYSLTHQWTKAVLATHAKSLDSWSLALLTGWRIFELALGWFCNYDGYDLAALNVLSHGPPLYLLSAFYDVPPSALILTLAIETASNYLPFRLLRPLSVAHGDPASAYNADLLTDRPITVLTSLLAGAIYSVTLFAAYQTYLPHFLVVYLEKLPSITAAHEATYISIFPVTLIFGLATTVFVFTPAEAQEDEKRAEFDPVTATLIETFWWNIWGWSSRTKVVMKRTATLMLVTAANTSLQTLLTIEGAEVPGAIAWASVWVVAAAFTGLGLGVVGSV